MYDVVAVERETLEEMLAVADDSHPEEVVLHLRATESPGGLVVTEYLLVPRSPPKGAFEVLGVDSIPRNSDVVGTFASTADGTEPRERDYTRFANRGRVHVLAWPPYDLGCWKAYTSDGRARDLDVR
ncbi:MAG: hypothetical protein ACLFMT_01495 [Halobacteriales archaeon]